MKKKVLVILGHVSDKSFCGALYKSYANGAKSAGNKVKRWEIGKMDFDPVLKKGYKEVQELEPSLISLQKDIKWADHITFVFPTWWASMPAKLKGLLDRMIIPGFAFNYKSKDSLRWDAHLKGKSASVLITMDALPIYHRMIVGSPGYRLMKDTLKFCGIKPVRKSFFGSVKLSDEKKRLAWIKKAHSLGERLK